PTSEAQAGRERARMCAGRISRLLLPWHAALALAGCGAEPPPPPESLYDDAALAELVDANDGIDGVAPRLGAFAGGEHVRYWHLGERGATPMRAYRVYEEGEGG